MKNGLIVGRSVAASLTVGRNDVDVFASRDALCVAWVLAPSGATGLQSGNEGSLEVHDPRSELKRDHLVGPHRPVGGHFQCGAPGAIDQ